MTRSKSKNFFRLLPEAHRAAIAEFEATQGIKIQMARPLKGGRSGSYVYHTTWDNSSRSLKTLIMKISEVNHNNYGEPSEDDRHTRALEDSPSDFRRDHMVDLAHPSYHSIQNGILLIFYEIAGKSISGFNAISSHDSLRDLERVFRWSHDTLLKKWNAATKLTSKLYYPIELIQSWLGYRIGSDGYIEKIVQQYMSDPNRSRLEIKNEILPNPLGYARQSNFWQHDHQLVAIKSFVHGDLNLNNLLIQHSGDEEKIVAYRLIDFALYQADQFLFYDQSYLKLSYFIEYVQNESLDSIISFISQLAAYQVPPQQIPARFVPVRSVFSAAQKAFEGWAKEYSTDGDYDTLYGQYLLASVAAGLNFTNKQALSHEQRLISYLYAAAHLKRYLEHFKVAIYSKDAPSLFSIGENTDSFLNVQELWEDFYEACDQFKSSRNIFVLIAGPIDCGQTDVCASLGHIPWSLVMDFDPATTSTGLYSVSSSELNRRRDLRLITRLDQSQLPPLDPSTKTYWYAALGIRERPDTLVMNVREWERNYDRATQEYLVKLAANSRKLPVKVIILWDHPEYVSSICRSLDQAFSETQLDFVFVTPQTQYNRPLVEKYNALHIELSLQQLASFLSRNPIQERIGTPIRIPDGDSQFLEIPIEKYNEVRADLEIVHLQIEQQQDHRDESTSRSLFMRGNRISWAELNANRDIPRPDITNYLKKRISQAIKARKISTINLKHYTGAGGTTVARRIAWDLHFEYPVVIINKITRETPAYFRILRNITKQPIIAIIEIASTSNDLLQYLYLNLKFQNLQTIVIFAVTRKYNLSQAEEKRQNELEMLDDQEAKDFFEVYRQEVRDSFANQPNVIQERLAQLEQLAADDNETRLPFFFGLTAFEEDFIGLNEYIRSKLEGMTDIQRDLMVFIALSSYYGDRDRGISAQVFSSLFPNHKTVDLNLILTNKLKRLLVRDISPDGIVVWKTAHSLIAQKILEIVLSGLKE